MQFFKKHKGKIAIVAVVLIMIWLISATASKRNKITSAESFIGSVISPVSGAIYGVGTKVSMGFSSVGDIFNLREENEKLREENAKLKEDILEYETVIGGAVYLENAYKLRQNTEYDMVSAKVTSKDPGNWFERFTINRGSNSGIEIGDAVVLGFESSEGMVKEGLVGKVLEVGDSWAKVSSIVDIGNNISFNLVRNKDAGVIKGNLEGGLEGYMFDTDTDVKKGDKLVTSGMGGVYQRDLFIGEVTEVKRNSNDLLVHIEAETQINFSNLYEVFVVTGIKE